MPLFNTLLSELGDEKLLLISFRKRLVRMSILARFVALILNFLRLCRNKSQ